MRRPRPLASWGVLEAPKARMQGSLLTAAQQRLDVRLGAQQNRAAPGSVHVARALEAHDDAAAREVGRRHQLEQLLVGQLGIGEQCAQRIDELGEVVRRAVGRHADRDAGGAVEEEHRQPRGQHGRLGLRRVEVVHKVDD
eukprot:4157212-Prymnesium_polylepis.1